jgi:hypothetical protein
MAFLNLIAQHTQRFLIPDIDGFGSPANPVPPGRPIVQDMRGELGSGGNVFELDEVGNGIFRVVSEYSGMVFDVSGASMELGAPVILWPWHGGSNQRFKLLEAPRPSIEAWGYSLKAEHSGLVLDVFGASDEPGAPVVQWEYHGGPNQLFRALGCPIKPLHSSFVLDVTQASQDNGALISQFPFHGGPNQQFRIELLQSDPNDPFSYRIVANHSGKVFDVEGASLANGARVIQWDWHGGLNQQFELFKDPGANGYIFRAMHSGKVLDISGASLDQGALLIQWDNHFGPNQRFRL